MQSIYHPRGIWRAGAGPAWRHLRRWAADPAYRALHRFSHQLGALPRRTAATVRFFGKPVHLCDGSSFLSAWDEIFVNRIYDLGGLSGRPRLVDVGANVGLAALYWNLRYGEIRYLGFEPDPEIASICRANLATWGVGGTLVEAAAGVRSGQTEFLRDGADGGKAVAASVSATGRTIQVRVEELAPYLDEATDLLKIDIEGGERSLLPSLAPVISRVGCLFVEWHCEPVGPSGLGEAIALMEQWGFTVLVQPVAWQDQPFVRLSPSGYEGQHVNLFAVRR